MVYLLEKKMIWEVMQPRGDLPLLHAISICNDPYPRFVGFQIWILRAVSNELFQKVKTDNSRPDPISLFIMMER